MFAEPAFNRLGAEFWAIIKFVSKNWVIQTGGTEPCVYLPRMMSIAFVVK